MKKFVFRLQVVLDRALDEEEARMRQLAEVQAERARKEQEIMRAGEAREQVMANITTLQQQPFDPRDMQRCHLHLESLAKELAQRRAEAAEIEARVETARQALVEAMRKRQVLEKLREKQLRDYKREEQREELRAMEEAALPRLARERAEEIARFERARAKREANDDGHR